MTSIGTGSYRLEYLGRDYLSARAFLPADEL